MPARAFFDEGAKAAVKAAIERIEAQTAAEVVVTVRRTTGHYRDADLLVGAACALAALGALLFTDREFDVTWMPLDVALAFVAGALVSAWTPTVRRALVSGARRGESVRRAACEAFVDQKVTRTTGRTGILVLVGMFERRARVVVDLGCEGAAATEAFARAVRGIEASVEHLDPKLDAFVAALEALGPALAGPLPRQADDVNELSDDLGVA